MSPAFFSRANLRRAGVGRGDSGALVALLLQSSSADNGHRLVWSLFDGEPDAPRDFLYRRIDTGAFLILSRRRPADPHGLWRLETKDWLPALSPGDRLGFSLQLNATVSRPVPGSGRGRRVALAALARQRGQDLNAAAHDWLSHRIEAAEIDSAGLTASVEPELGLEGSNGGRARFSPLCVDGALTVRRPEPLTALIAKGVGRSKAYGFGLMLIRRI